MGFHISLLEEDSMLQKSKITPCALILCLFGLTLMTVTPVFAEGSQEFIACKNIKWKGNQRAKKNCFKDLARDLIAANDAQKTCKRHPS